MDPRVKPEDDVQVKPEDDVQVKPEDDMMSELSCSDSIGASKTMVDPRVKPEDDVQGRPEDDRAKTRPGKSFHPCPIRTSPKPKSN